MYILYKKLNFYIKTKKKFTHIGVLMKKRSHQKFLHKMSINFKNNLQTKLPRDFALKYV